MELSRESNNNNVLPREKSLTKYKVPITKDPIILQKKKI